jgi:putative membrane protein
MKAKAPIIALTILVILHTVGLIGTAFFDEDLMKLTPVNLIISVAIVLWFHESYNKLFVFYLAVVYTFGYLLEFAGIRSGKIFGQYFYGNNLGIKLADVPLIIGVNWVMLSYCSMSIVGILSDKFTSLKHQFIAPVIGAILMVFSDFWIEQLSQRLDFWYWKNNTIPIQNYTAWFLFSFAFNLLFVRLHLYSTNKVAAVLFILQLLFFIGLNVFLN